ncbi:hypothetical protein CPB84DRAFT_1208366 [Gymnopilus junonius]|uniref:Uncharacterized protein n=1 Tax=Gymnopilus junonius TaxID=109634 RepID=A0A9P5NKT9_GYMJU|nr:hypothetical protein CPB84DRAFT_1208366 [Gymnopilus junonius]
MIAGLGHVLLIKIATCHPQHILHLWTNVRDELQFLSTESERSTGPYTAAPGQGNREICSGQSILIPNPNPNLLTGLSLGSRIAAAKETT